MNQVFNHAPGTVQQIFGNEVLVFEPTAGATHLLGSLSARIFSVCDGKSLDELSNLLSGDTDRTHLEQQLMSLVDLGVLTTSGSGVTDLLGRRRFLAGAAQAAAVLTVATVMMPTPAAAASMCPTNSFTLRPATTTNSAPPRREETNMVQICIPFGATSVTAVGTGNVDEILTFSASGTGSTGMTVSVSSFPPQGGCQARSAMNFPNFDAPVNISSLFTFPMTPGTAITPTVTGMFCNGGGAGRFPAVTINVT